MAPPQGIYHTGSKDYLGDKATMLSSGWTQNNKTLILNFSGNRFDCNYLILFVLIGAYSITRIYYRLQLFIPTNIEIGMTRSQMNPEFQCQLNDQNVRDAPGFLRQFFFLAGL